MNYDACSYARQNTARFGAFHFRVRNLRKMHLWFRVKVEQNTRKRYESRKCQKGYYFQLYIRRSREKIIFGVSFNELQKSYWIFFVSGKNVLWCNLTIKCRLFKISRCLCNCKALIAKLFDIPIVSLRKTHLIGWVFFALQQIFLDHFRLINKLFCC